MTYRHQSGPWPKQGAEGVHVQPPIVGDRREAQDDALALAQEMPGDDVGVMLHLREDNFVALRESAAEGRSHQIDRLCGALGEHDLIDAGRIDHPPHRFARALVSLGGFVGEGVQAAVDVGVAALHDRDHGVDHRARLLRRCGAVEIDQRLAVDLAAENGKFRARRGDVKAHGAAPSRSATQAAAIRLAPSSPMRSMTSPTRSRSSRCVSPSTR